jgi:hypothetical protein
MRLCLIDGSSPSYIMHATDISVWFPCRTTHQVRFLITKLNTKFPAVLRLDWLTLHNPLINWADSSVTFRDHPDTLPVITTQSVLANQEELPSDDDTSFKFSEGLPDPNPVNIPEPTTEFISNPTVDSISVPNTVPVSNSILSNSSTNSIPLISLKLKAFIFQCQLYFHNLDFDSNFNRHLGIGFTKVHLLGSRMNSARAKNLGPYKF